MLVKIITYLIANITAGFPNRGKVITHFQPNKPDLESYFTLITD